MATTSDFLANFESSLNKLNKLSDYITRNTTNKREFTGFVLTKLRELNEKVKLFIIRFNELKAQVVTLQSQINDNSSGIQNKDGEIVNLKVELERLNKEKSDLKEFIDNELPKNTQKNVDLERKSEELQVKIDEMETKLRELEAQNVELTNQKNTLQQELSSRGDVQAEHAKSIEELSNKNKAELTKSQQDNAAQIDQLQKEIADRESKSQANVQQMEQIQKQIAEKDNQIQSISQKIQELEQKISEKDSQLAEKDRQIAELQQNTSTTQQQQQQNTEAITEATNRIKQLEKEKSDLENDNKDLVQRIIAATDAINIATAQLEELVNQGFYDKSKQDVDVIIKEIEASLQLISNSIQGSNITKVSNSNNSSYDKNIINLNGVLTNVNSLVRDLQAKSNQLIRNNNGKNVYDKYKAAYESIREFKNQNPNATDDDIKSKTKETLSKYNISISNTGIIQGGNMNLKKSKKKIRKPSTTRKQKGGYLWGKQKTFSFKNKTISKISKSVPTPKSHKKRL